MAARCSRSTSASSGGLILKLVWIVMIEMATIFRVRNGMICVFFFVFFFSSSFSFYFSVFFFGDFFFFLVLCTRCYFGKIWIYYFYLGLRVKALRLAYRIGAYLSLFPRLVGGLEYMKI